MEVRSKDYKVPQLVALYLHMLPSIPLHTYKLISKIIKKQY